MRIAIVYHSGGGNTHALAMEIAARLPEAEVFRVKDFDVTTVTEYDGLLVGTYTWGNGDMPHRMVPFYRSLEDLDIRHLKTAVFGTGETGYKHYCKSVDDFRDMLFAKSELVATLKVEQMLQDSDLPRIEKLCEIVRGSCLEKD
jgi:flavodoxin I